MNVFIISIQTSRDINIENLVSDYSKRIFGSFTEIEIKLNKHFSSTEKQKDFEAELIQKKIPDSSFIVAMDENGDSFSSERFSDFLYQNQIYQNIVFLIGGANGLSKKILSLANKKISLSKMTMPHKIAKLVLVEQIYRAQQINQNHPYHK